jgi:TolB-like protein/DNA-binding winged helix-turn-helix (wHTH) protein
VNRPLELPRISVDLSREPDFWIGALKVQPSHRQVSANGHQETVQPRVMQVFVALARAKGGVLSRDDLVEACWDGLTVGDDAINRSVAKVRQIAEFGGGPHFEIETIPRVGYRLAPVELPVDVPLRRREEEVPGATITGDAATIVTDRISSPALGAPVRTGRNRGLVLAGLAMLMVALVGASLAWVLRPQSDRASLTRREPLLAVLPFRNLNADASSRYFSDGITQEIVDALLQVTEIRVAAAGSSFQLRHADATRAARTLAATHVLTGSVERHGSDLRVVAQITDMNHNRVIWSRIYRTTVAQTPALQHHIAMQIANALDMRLSSRSLNDAAHVDPVAYDHYLRGRDLFRQRLNLSVAKKELEASVALAPDFAKAWSTLAAVRFVTSNYGDPDFQKDSAQGFKAARIAAMHALALDRINGEALGVVAIGSEQNRIVEDRLFERALQAEPNNTQLLNWHSTFLHSVGRQREASEEIERAYELDRLTPAVVFNAAKSFMERGDFERARQIMELALDYCPTEAVFELRALYLLWARDWNGLARHLHDLPPGGGWYPSFYRLAEETSVAIAKGQKDKFATLRTRWRTISGGDRLYAITFLIRLRDTVGALQVIAKAVASGAQSESMLLLAPAQAALRREPEAKALMAKWGLFDYWRQSNHWPDFCEEPGLPFDCKAEARRLAQRPSAESAQHAL